MAKMFGGAPSAQVGGAPVASPRPMPRPADLGGATPAQKPGGFLSGFLGDQGSDARYEMAKQLLQSAMSGATDTKSPAMAFLTPIIGSMVGARMESQRATSEQTETDAMTKGLLGENLSRQARQALAVLSNPDAPDHLKSIAATMLKGQVPLDSAGPRQKSGGGGGKRRSSGSRPGTPSRPRLYGDIVEFDGVPGKYDGSGKWWPLLGPDGQNAPGAPPTAAPDSAPPSTPTLPSDPVLPRDPAMEMTDNELLNRY